MQWNYITDYIRTSVVRSHGDTDLEGELFALKSNVHQLGDRTHGNIATEEEDRSHRPQQMISRKDQD